MELDNNVAMVIIVGMLLIAIPGGLLANEIHDRETTSPANLFIDRCIDSCSDGYSGMGEAEAKCMEDCFVVFNAMIDKCPDMMVV